MPSQDFGEKTEPATQRKKQEARERGQVAKSSDLNVAVLLLGAFFMFYLWGESMMHELEGIITSCFSKMAHFDCSPQQVVALFSEKTWEVISLLAPFGLVLAGIAFLSTFVQIGPVWSGTVLTPDPNRLNPVSGFGRIFSLRGIMRTVMGVCKLAIIAVVLYTVLVTYVTPGESKSLFALFSDDLRGSFILGKTAVCELGLLCACAMLLLALLDFGYQKLQHEMDLRMSKQEVREELKRFEGDPKIKERRRRAQRQIALQRLMHEVPKADVVVTNPTHYAVAIAYDPDHDGAPRVVAKGEGIIAQRIREIAIASEVPVVEKPPLARTLYRFVEVGGEIPKSLYEAVAEVLAYVWKLSGGNRKGVA